MKDVDRQSYNYIEYIEIFEKHFSDSQLGDIRKGILQLIKG